VSSSAAFTAFDLETTGLIPGLHRIVEIGAVSFNTNGVVGTFQTLVDPQTPMPEEAGRINGITDEMLAGQPLISEALPRFLSFLGDSYPVAHNAAFDVGFVCADLARFGLEAPDTPIFDTRVLAKSAFPGRFSYSLKALRDELGLAADGAHRALADAGVCRELFLACAGRLVESGAMDGDEGMKKLLTLSGAPLSFVTHKPPEVERIVALSGALERGESVEISYRDAGGERTSRKITPISFRMVGGAPVVEAYCHLRQANRTFLLSSIERIEMEKSDPP
jgi:DNA polymerase-3 subunit epsilon